MKEIGVDDKGRRMVAVNSDALRLIVPTGQSVTFTRRHLVGIIAKHQAEIDKWKKYLDALDGAANDAAQPDCGHPFASDVCPTCVAADAESEVNDAMQT